MGTVPGRIARVLMVQKRVRPQPEQLRHHGSRKQEESGGEGLAKRHSGIVAHPAIQVKPVASSRSPSR